MQVSEPLRDALWAAYSGLIDAAGEADDQGLEDDARALLDLAEPIGVMIENTMPEPVTVEGLIRKMMALLAPPERKPNVTILSGPPRH